eukprot:6180290-Pleurochrysis_carterae.AAC.2
MLAKQACVEEHGCISLSSSTPWSRMRTATLSLGELMYTCATNSLRLIKGIAFEGGYEASILVDASAHATLSIEARRVCTAKRLHAQSWASRRELSSTLCLHSVGECFTALGSVSRAHLHRRRPPPRARASHLTPCEAGCSARRLPCLASSDCASRRARRPSGLPPASRRSASA